MRYRAKVLRVTDGDSLLCRVTVWPNVTWVGGVRLHGIDTPEKGWRAKSDWERTLAARAKGAVLEWLTFATENSNTVILANVKPGKFARRILATVSGSPRYIDLATYLTDRGLAVPYSGRGPRHDWSTHEL